MQHLNERNVFTIGTTITFSTCKNYIYINRLSDRSLLIICETGFKYSLV